jgi:hypothetical protein
VVAAGVATIWWLSQSHTQGAEPSLSRDVCRASYPWLSSNESRDTSSQREAMTRDLISQLVRARHRDAESCQLPRSQLRAANTRRSSALVQENSNARPCPGGRKVHHRPEAQTETRLRLVNVRIEGETGFWSETIYR